MRRQRGSAALFPPRRRDLRVLGAAAWIQVGVVSRLPGGMVGGTVVANDRLHGISRIDSAAVQAIQTGAATSRVTLSLGKRCAHMLAPDRTSAARENPRSAVQMHGKNYHAPSSIGRCQPPTQPPAGR